jgi:NADPH:quinone reductase-like Zn-dependent oxidoreductase
MKAAQINKYGSTKDVEINQNARKPLLTTGHLIVQVYAAGVNPVDWKICEGLLKERLDLQFPITLGMDFSGVVREVGEGVSEFKEGDEVYGQSSIFNSESGAFAELVAVDKKRTAHKPKKISYEEAAAVPLAAVSAWQGLVDHMHLTKGQKILIHGGTGGIGGFAIQLAKHLGAYVATTVSADNKQQAKDLGADEVIDYKNEAFEDLLHDYDAVFDTVGGETYVKSFKVLKNGGVIVSLLEHHRPELNATNSIRAISEFTQVNGDRLEKVAELIDKGILKIHIDKAFPLDKASKALEYMKTGHPRGKVVLKIN